MLHLVTDMNIERAVTDCKDSIVIIHFRKDGGIEVNPVTEALSALSEAYDDVVFLEGQVQETMYMARSLGVPDDGISSVAILSRNGSAKVTEVIKRLDNINPEKLADQLEPWLQQSTHEGR